MDDTTDPLGGSDSTQLPVPRTGEDGKPVYDQEFFLALARRGKDERQRKDEWNRWRESNPDIAVTFKGIDFRKDAIGFAGFRFGDLADFTGALFGRGANFSGSIFGDGSKFSSTEFGDVTNFSGAVFGRETNFSGAGFGDGVNFSRATFEYGAKLSRAKFGFGADFSNVTFWHGADLSGAIFGYYTKFACARFGNEVVFSRATFEGDVDFSAFSREQAETDAMVRPELRSTAAGPDNFLAVSFSRARFLGFANFSGRKFNGRCDLTGARFYQPPSFEACDRLDRLDLYGAKIRFMNRPAIQTRGWTTVSEIANRLRRLRGIAEITKNHDLERDLYIEERKAERGILLAHFWNEGWISLLKPELYGHGLWIAVMGFYWLLADYGRSFVRPLAVLVISVPLFWWAYSTVLTPNGRPDDFRRAALAFAISNALPFVGALALERDVKLTLICGDRSFDAEKARLNNTPMCVPEPGYQVLAILQSIFSALCIFFAGLALRNYFKLR
jgi:uncharacterized protein YjbI with pentapeptide repeats